jgi:hypothetical protein
VARQNLRFCRERPEKAEHARALGLTRFIDDRADVLQALRGVVDRRYLFGPQPRPQVEPGVIPVADWAAVLRAAGEPLVHCHPALTIEGDAAASGWRRKRQRRKRLRARSSSPSPSRRRCWSRDIDPA